MKKKILIMAIFAAMSAVSRPGSACRAQSHNNLSVNNNF